jgi:hypothetical protein
LLSCSLKHVKPGIIMVHGKLLTFAGIAFACQMGNAERLECKHRGLAKERLKVEGTGCETPVYPPCLRR